MKNKLLVLNIYNNNYLSYLGIRFQSLEFEFWILVYNILIYYFLGECSIVKLQKLTNLALTVSCNILEYYVY